MVAMFAHRGRPDREDFLAVVVFLSWGEAFAEAEAHFG